MSPLPKETKESLPEQRRVRLFRNGRNQAVRIPREFEFKGQEAIIRKEGNRLILEEPPQTDLVAFLDGLKPLDEETLVSDDDLPPLDDIAL